MSFFAALFGGSGGSSIGDAIVARARQDVGRTEEGGNNRGLVVSEALRGTGHSSAAWCAGAATNWTNDAAKSQLGCSIVRTTAGVADSMSDFRSAGAFKPFNGDLSGVRPGDSVFFKRNGGGHMGIVSSVQDGSISIIEGNVSVGGGNEDGRGRDGVREETFSVADLQARNILGFGDIATRASSATNQGISGGMHVAQTSLGGISSPNFGGGNDFDRYTSRG